MLPTEIVLKFVIITTKHYFDYYTFYAVVRISYGNSVRLSVRPSVTTRYRFKTSKDRDFGFSLYGGLVSLVFRDKISRHWVKGVRTNEGAKEGHPS